jgi:hypothetical protein
LRSGLISFSCDKCLDAPYIKENLGCDQPTQTPARWLDEDEEWYNCPMRFIPSSVVSFILEYDSYKDKWSTPPRYGDFGAKFLQAKIYLENCLNKYTAMKQGH